jgi:hypothetical protein
MSPAEFETWFEFHRTRDRKFLEWTKKLSKVERDRLKTAFRLQVASITYRLARACSLRMLNRGNFEDGPAGWSRHGEIVAELAPRVTAEAYAAANRSPGGMAERIKQREEREALEKRYGRKLDSMDIDEVLGLVDRIRDNGNRISMRRLICSDRFRQWQANRILRPSLLRVLNEIDNPPDIFAGMDLGETPEEYKVSTNDQWENR